MSIRNSLENLRKKKEELRNDLKGTKEDLLTFRPRPVQSVIQRRVKRLRNGPLGERFEKIKQNIGHQETT